MATLYRVFPWLEGADAGEAGHPLFVPGLAGGRVDNPDHYLALYLSDGAGGACAEAFDYKPAWDAGMLRGPPSLVGSVRALATYTLDPDIMVCNLDDAHRLVELELRPSQVVSRDRMVTRGWALGIFREHRWGGISWWSYYDPRWSSHGVWAIDALTVDGVETLTLDHHAIGEAAEVLKRPIV
ncbi:MAG: RES domain-containing protein [Acidimicrobiia bacterium]